MILNLDYTTPSLAVNICGHCDERITIKEDFKYVKFSLGDYVLTFHEDCFRVILSALKQFEQVFITEQQSERGKKVH